MTKLAKLDFFVRYPQFFEQLCSELKLPKTPSNVVAPIESSMVRYHYGPWDKRYYHVLAYLEAKALISVTRAKSMYRFELTPQGKKVAEATEDAPAFADVVAHMRNVKNVLGKKAGSRIKDLIYEIFDSEIGKRSLGEVIE